RIENAAIRVTLPRRLRKIMQGELFIEGDGRTFVVLLRQRGRRKQPKRQQHREHARDAQPRNW
ncbi:hypothetical protein ACFL33_05325, partial [Pseudomonadota bacterium]